MLHTSLRYQVVRALGQGTVAKSYTAVATGAHGVARPVTLKLLEGEQASPLRKATLRALAIQHHHGILLPRAFLIDGASLAVVFDFVIAESLVWLMARCLERAEPLEEGLATHLFVQAAESLADLHEGRLGKAASYHGAIRPSNLLVSHVGRIWIDDTALAANPCDLAARDTMRAAHAQFATSEALEAARSGCEVVPAAVAQQNDVYGLVACLYSLVTAHWPHEAESLDELLALKGQAAPIAARQHNSRLSVGLEAMLTHTLAPKSPRPSARRIADALRKLASATKCDIAAEKGRVLADLPSPQQRALLALCSPSSGPRRDAAPNAIREVDVHGAATIESQITSAGELATAVSFREAITHVEMVQPLGLESILSSAGISGAVTGATFTEAVSLTDEVDTTAVNEGAAFADEPTDVQAAPPAAVRQREEEPITLVTPAEELPQPD